MSRGQVFSHAWTPLVFVVLAFGLSWAIWIPLALTRTESSLKDVASFGPAVAALLVALLNPELRTAWRRRLAHWGIPRHLYGIALLAPPLVCLGAVGLTEALGVPGLEYNDPAQLYLVVPAFVAVLVLGGPLGEEPGWRGVLQPALGRWFSPCRAGLLVGVVWAAWHLPLFAIPGTPQAQVPIGLYAAFTVGLGVIYGWLADRSGNSVLAAVLLHASSNTAAGVLPVLPGDAGASLLPFALVTAVTVSIAVALLARERGVRRRAVCQPRGRQMWTHDPAQPGRLALGRGTAVPEGRAARTPAKGELPMPVERRLAIADVLASLALILAAGASLAGLALSELYRDSPAMIAQARGTDLATLLVVVPPLGLGLWRARSGSMAAQLIVLGMLAYLVYAYAIFAFQVVINAATPAYIAILGLAIWSLILRLPVLGEVAERGIGARLPRRVTAGFLGFIVIAFGGLWLSEIIGAIVSGALPASVSDLDLPTSAVYTLDLAFLLPAMLVAAALLVRGAAVAAPLSIALLVFSVGMVLSILGLFAFQALDGIAVDPVMAVVFGLIGLVALVLAVVGLRSPHATDEVRVSGRHSARAGRAA